MAARVGQILCWCLARSIYGFAGKPWCRWHYRPECRSYTERQQKTHAAHAQRACVARHEILANNDANLRVYIKRVSFGEVYLFPFVCTVSMARGTSMYATSKSSLAGKAAPQSKSAPRSHGGPPAIQYSINTCTAHPKASLELFEKRDQIAARCSQKEHFGLRVRHGGKSCTPALLWDFRSIYGLSVLKTHGAHRSSRVTLGGREILEIRWCACG